MWDQECVYDSMSYQRHAFNSKHFNELLLSWMCLCNSGRQKDLLFLPYVKFFLQYFVELSPIFICFWKALCRSEAAAVQLVLLIIWKINCFVSLWACRYIFIWWSCQMMSECHMCCWLGFVIKDFYSFVVNSWFI